MQKVTIFTVALLVFGTLAVVTTVRVRAADGGLFNPLAPFGTSDVCGTGMVTIVYNQTLRLNIVNIGVPANACGVHLAILDANGNALSKSENILKPGASAHLDFPWPQSEVFQTQVRALIALDGKTNCAMLPTLEVLDNVSGRSSVAMRLDPIW